MRNLIRPSYLAAGSSLLLATALALAAGLAPGSYILDINGDLSGTPLDLGIPFIVRAADRR